MLVCDFLVSRRLVSMEKSIDFPINHQQLFCNLSMVIYGEFQRSYSDFNSINTIYFIFIIIVIY